MHTTPPSLLVRLRCPEDRDAWGQFALLYTPLLFHWARRLGLQDADAADLVQEVFTTLVQKLPGFRYEPTKRFRAWLWTITLNLWRMHQRRARREVARCAAVLEEPEVPDVVETLEDIEYRQYLMARALQLMQADFQPNTWKACWEHVVANRPAAEVAAELNLSVGAVYVASSRVLRRLRQELGELLD